MNTTKKHYLIRCLIVLAIALLAGWFFAQCAANAHDITWDSCNEFLDWSNANWNLDEHAGQQHIFVCTVMGAGYTPTSWNACLNSFSQSGVVNIRCEWWETRRSLCGNLPPSYCNDPGPLEPPEDPNLIFSDDFESGDTAKWSKTVGGDQ